MKFTVIDLGAKGLMVMETKRQGQWETFNQALCEDEVKVIRVCLLAWGWIEIEAGTPKELFATSSGGYYDAYVKGWIGSRRA